MTPRFNLVDERWLPCLMIQNGEVHDLSLHEVFAEAHEVRELIASSPLVTVALHRLLLAVLHRALNGPKNKDEWRSLWRANKFDDRVTSELVNQKENFWLLHDTRPFYQVPGQVVEKLKEHPIQWLAHELSSGNNAAWFDHSVNSQPVRWSDAEAARYLVAMQSFGLGGGKTGGEDEDAARFEDSPLAREYVVLVRGDSLFETLMLNLVEYNEAKPFNVGAEAFAHDKPAWEELHAKRSKPKGEKGYLPRGYLDSLTWQSRRISVFEQPDGLYCRREQNLALRMEHHSDPFKCYNLSGGRAFRIEADRALWRDCHTLFHQTEWAAEHYGNVKTRAKRPEVFNHLAQVGREIGRKRFRFDLFGLAANKASVRLWRHERLPLPLECLEDRRLWGELNRAVGLAELVGDVLRQGARLLAVFQLVPNWHLLYPDWRKRIRDNSSDGEQRAAEGKKKPEFKDKGHRECEDDVEQLFRSFQHGARYWARLGTAFPSHMVHLANDKRATENGCKWGERAQPAWANAVEQAAGTTFDEIARGVGSSERGLRAVALAEQHFGRKLRLVTKRFKANYVETEARKESQ